MDFQPFPLKQEKEKRKEEITQKNNLQRILMPQITEYIVPLPNLKILFSFERLPVVGYLQETICKSPLCHRNIFSFINHLHIEIIKISPSFVYENRNPKCKKKGNLICHHRLLVAILLPIAVT